MSYDLQIWSVHPVTRFPLEDGEAWKESRVGWERSSDGWQISVSQSDRVIPEDIPDDVAAGLPGIEYLTGVTLEGARTAKPLALSTATALARSCHGVVIDQEKGTAHMPSGVIRLLPMEKPAEVFSTITFSWWFLDSPILTRAGRDHFLRVLEKELPECLPKRYGPHEPPQYHYSEEKRDHLLDMLDQRRGLSSPVWYAHWPVVSLHLLLPESAGGSRIGFRANHLKIEVDTGVLTQPGWNTQLHRFWVEVSQLVRPIYGDVRTLHGRVRRKEEGNYSCDRGTEQHPIISWWWRGIPLTLGSAVVLGTEYQELWPDMVARARVENRLAFVTTDIWGTDADLAQTTKVPISLAARPHLGGPPKSYPEVWPFEPPLIRR